MSDGGGIVAYLRFQLRNESWMLEAACRGKGPDHFFPEKNQRRPDGETYCAACPVTSACGDYADRINARDGIWGGALRNRHYEAHPDEQRETDDPQVTECDGSTGLCGMPEAV